MWKHVGNDGHNSGVQVAPQWVITSAHAAPAPNAGWVFTNRFGSATITDVTIHPKFGVWWPGWNDVAVAHLDHPLGAGPYPALVDGKLDDVTASQQQGQMLGTGWADGTLHADWNNPAGVVDGLDRPPVTNRGGDSGGGIFWYSPRSNRPVLTGVEAGETAC